MKTAIRHPQDQLIAFSRRQLWFALGAVLVLAAVAAGTLVFPGAEGPTRLFSLLPIVIVLALAALKTSGGRDAPTSAEVRALVDDELRQASQHRASRNGFLAMLTAQAVLAPGLVWFSPPNPVALMAVLTIATGLTVFLASLLYHDR
jgi:hypothetical protein